MNNEVDCWLLGIFRELINIPSLLKNGLVIVNYVLGWNAVQTELRRPSHLATLERHLVHSGWMVEWYDYQLPCTYTVFYSYHQHSNDGFRCLQISGSLALLASLEGQ